MAHRIGFVVEQGLGHATHLANLRTAVARDPDIAAAWMPVKHHQDDLPERIPGLPFTLRVSLRARRQVRAALSEGDLEGLFLHTQAVAVTLPDILARLPAVISLDATPENFRSIAAAYDARIAGGWIGRAKAAHFRRLFQRARGLVAWSDWVRDSLIGDYGVAPGRVVVVPPGVDLDLWPAHPASSVRQRPLRLLFVGGDFRRKGGPLLLQAFREALGGFCELDLVTQTPPAEVPPGVRIHRGLTPNAPALRDLYAQADVFVLPSRGEGTPLAILEAMASGLPVIACAVGAVAEAVEDGVSGFLIAPDDTAALVTRLSALAADRPRLQGMGAAARRRVEVRFDARQNYARLLAYLRHVLAGDAPAAAEAEIR